MTSMNPLFRTIQMVLFVVLSAVSCCYCQAPNELNVLGSPVNEKTAVRFFFDPGNYFHPPLIFRVVAPKDPRLNTAPMLQEGRTAYISGPEMQRLLQGLKSMELSWKESKKQTEFGDATKILPVFYGLSVVVVSSRGTAESGIDLGKICEDLAPLDSTLTTPRALWEFQVFRAEYNCKVPGLDGQAYPDHWPWNAGSENSAGSHPKQQ